MVVLKVFQYYREPYKYDKSTGWKPPNPDDGQTRTAIETLYLALTLLGHICPDTWYSSEKNLGSFDTSLCGPQKQ
jgi:hypothetical protein